MRPSLTRLLQAFVPFESVTSRLCRTIPRARAPRRHPREPGLNNVELIHLGDDRIRAAFKGVVAVDVVEEIIEARKGIWGDQNGGESLQFLSYLPHPRLLCG